MLAEQRTGYGFLILCLAAVSTGLLNSLKPVHIDDALYLSIAEHILQKPWDPYGGIINWQHVPQPAYQVSISPPLLNYYFAIVMAVFGNSLLTLHLSMIPWMLLLAWSIYHLTRRWTTQPVFVSLTLLCAPPLVVGMNLMLDVPLLACTCTSIELAIRCATRQHRIGFALLSGVAASAAVLIKYPGACLIVLLAYMTLYYRTVLLLISAALPAVALFAWQTYSRQLYGASQVGEALGFLEQFHTAFFRQIAERSLQTCALLGMTFPIWVLALADTRQRTLRFIVSLTLAVIATSMVMQKYAVAHSIAFGAATGLGSLALLTAAMGIWCTLRRNSDAKDSMEPSPGSDLPEVLLGLWILGFAAVAILFGPFIAVRSTLPLSVPLAVLLSRRCASPTLWAGTLAATVLLSGALFWTDVRWARTYPDAVRAIAERHPETQQVLFLGHWGLQYYAERAGMSPWDARLTGVPPGIVVVKPLRADQQFMHPLAANRLQPLATIRIAPHPLRLTVWNRPAGIRFYGGDFGELPWGFSTEPIEKFTILQAAP